MMLLLMVFLAKPMFKVSKPLSISKYTMVVTWQIFQGLLENILSCHLIISMLEKHINIIS
jgi:hypothetical protein